MSTIRDRFGKKKELRKYLKAIVNLFNEYAIFLDWEKYIQVDENLFSYFSLARTFLNVFWELIHKLVRNRNLSLI